MPERQLESLARWTPILVLAYFAAQFIIRVGLSGNLETDEAQFVGQTHLALGYGNSHPPLYNWLIAGALMLTGGAWPAAMALVKNALLAGAYLLAYDAARRVTGRALTGAIVAASFLMLPQIVWKSQITLAHSVLVMFAVVAALHAVVLILRRGDLAAFLWLGLAAGIGALAKYNFFLTLAAILVAAFSIPDFRRRVFTPKLAASLAVLAAMFAPHLVWALRHLDSTTERMAKLDRDSGAFSTVDLPFLGVDGLLDLAQATLAWAGPLLVAWFAIRQLGGAASSAPAESERADYSRFFGRALAVGAGGFAAIIFAGDMHSVHERYLTPLLMPLPFWLALAWPLRPETSAPRHFLRLGAALALLMVTAWPLWITFGREQFAFPYDALARRIEQAVPEPFSVVGPHYKYAANIAIRVPRASIWQDGGAPQRVVAVWEQKGRTSPGGFASALGDRFQPQGEPLAFTLPYENLSGAQARILVQVYARKE